MSIVGLMDIDISTPEDLWMYFAEHASQARKHEERREKATSLILTISGALTGLITFATLSFWSLPAAIAIMLPGVFGLLFRAFRWPNVRADDPSHQHARSWISRQRLNVF